ncbi:MAG: dockerin type I repeat-containing protein [Desulfuromonadaceae bacterium]
MKHIILTTMLVALLLPTAAMSAVMSSPSYRINGAGIVSGGGSSTDAAGNSKSGIAIGQMVFLPPEGVSSPSYKTQAAVIASPEAGGIHSGDVNNDGRVDIVDALLALKAGVGLVALTTQEKVRADVGPLVRNVPVGDGIIDIEDSMLILRKAVGLWW